MQEAMISIAIVAACIAIVGHKCYLIGHDRGYWEGHAKAFEFGRDYERKWGPGAKMEINRDGYTSTAPERTAP